MFFEGYLPLNLDGAGGNDVELGLGVSQAHPGAGYFGGVFHGLFGNTANMLVSSSSGFAIALAQSDSLGPGANYWSNYRQAIFFAQNGSSFANLAFGSTGYIGFQFTGETGSQGSQPHPLLPQRPPHHGTRNGAGAEPARQEPAPAYGVKWSTNRSPNRADRYRME